MRFSYKQAKYAIFLLYKQLVSHNQTVLSFFLQKEFDCHILPIQRTGLAFLCSEIYIFFFPFLYLRIFSVY